MELSEEKTENGVKSLIEAGAEITGSVTGAAIGLLFAGLTGAIIGGATGPLVTRALIRMANDLQERFLSKREKARIGAVIYYATIKIQEKLEAGNDPRSDEFFKKPSIGRPDAEEIFEGVLLAAKKGHEEKKLPFLGYLFANIAFDSRIDKWQANLLIKIAAQISYRQMCLLNLYSNQSIYAEKFSDKRDSLSKLSSNDPKKSAIKQEIWSLIIEDLLYYPGHVSYGGHSFPSSKIKIRELGSVVYSLMELWRIDENDMQYNFIYD